MNECRACEAPIRWARTAKGGKAIPLDLEPAETGNVVLEENAGLGQAPTAHVVGKNGLPLELAHLADAPRYMPHHATCPKWGKR